MNNPRRIQFANGNVTEYISSAGTKLCATSRTLSAGVLSPMTGVMQQSSAVSPRDGEIHFTYYCGNVIYDGITPVYHYYLKDHLGNNRVVLGQNGAVEQVNHYYPFGGLMGESIGGSTQPYKYNGKELDRANGLDWCDYGARWYDATRIGWTSVDSHCEKYYDASPYVYCGDNPIKYMDPNGEDKKEFLNNQDRNSSNYDDYPNSTPGEYHVFMHGLYKSKYSDGASSLGLYRRDEEGNGYYERVRTSKDFLDNVLSDSYEWQKNGGKNITIVIHACGAAKIAKRFSGSEEFKGKNIKFVAPNNRIKVITYNDGHKISYVKDSKLYIINDLKNVIGVRKGKWCVYKDGNEIKKEPFNSH